MSDKYRAGCLIRLIRDEEAFDDDNWTIKGGSFGTILRSSVHALNQWEVIFHDVAPLKSQIRIINEDNMDLILLPLMSLNPNDLVYAGLRMVMEKSKAARLAADLFEPPVAAREAEIAPDEGVPLLLTSAQQIELFWDYYRRFLACTEASPQKTPNVPLRTLMDAVEHLERSASRKKEAFKLYNTWMRIFGERKL